MAPTTTHLLAELAKLDAVAELIRSANIEVVDAGADAERFCSRYKAVLVSPSGMVWRETLPHNDLSVIAQRVARWA